HVEQVDARLCGAGIVGKGNDVDARRAGDAGHCTHLVRQQRPKNERRSFAHRLARRLCRPLRRGAGVLDGQGDVVLHARARADEFHRELRAVGHRGTDRGEAWIASQRQQHRHLHRPGPEALALRGRRGLRPGDRAQHVGEIEVARATAAQGEQRQPAQQRPTARDFGKSVGDPNPCCLPPRSFYTKAGSLLKDGNTPKTHRGRLVDARRYFIAGTEFQAPELAPGLHVVATPIGNLRDMTLRGLETLAAADVIYCEDTRTSARLCEHFGIGTPRKALHEHNERALIGTILEDLRRGGRVALISDAGTPLLSDPGFPLVRAAREDGLPVFAAPGASALLSALAVAGLPTDAFSFFGFLPSKTEGREKALRDLAARTETLVFYESPRRLAESLGAMAKVFGAERGGVVALELTKKFE